MAARTNPLARLPSSPTPLARPPARPPAGPSPRAAGLRLFLRASALSHADFLPPPRLALLWGRGATPSAPVLTDGVDPGFMLDPERALGEDVN